MSYRLSFWFFAVPFEKLANLKTRLQQGATKRYYFVSICCNEREIFYSWEGGGSELRRGNPSRASMIPVTISQRYKTQDLPREN